MLQLLMLALLALLAWPAAAAPAAPSCRTEAVSFKTADGWTLAGLYCKPKKGKPVAVLAHGLASSKGEWEKFSPELWRLGWGTLAVDLRGHAASTSGPAGPADLAMVDAVNGWPQARLDLEGSAAFLKKEKKIPAGRLVLIGASLGANLCAQAAARLSPRATVLLSPGRDYRGVLLPERLGPKFLVGASPSDPYAHQTLVGLEARRDGAALLKGSAGHGVQMLDDPAFRKALLAWLQKSR